MYTTLLFCWTFFSWFINQYTYFRLLSLPVSAIMEDKELLWGEDCSVLCLVRTLDNVSLAPYAVWVGHLYLWTFQKVHLH